MLNLEEVIWLSITDHESILGIGLNIYKLWQCGTEHSTKNSLIIIKKRSLSILYENMNKFNKICKTDRKWKNAHI